MRQYDNEIVRTFPDEHPRGIDVQASVVITRQILDWYIGIAKMPDGSRMFVECDRFERNRVWTQTSER